MNYAQKLQDPRWQKKRLRIMERDCWRCVSCNHDEETLTVHHTRYDTSKEPWDYEDDDLVTLCKTCHEALHKFPFYYNFSFIYDDRWGWSVSYNGRCPLCNSSKMKDKGSYDKCLGCGLSLPVILDDVDEELMGILKSQSKP